MAGAPAAGAPAARLIPGPGGLADLVAQVTPAVVQVQVTARTALDTPFGGPGGTPFDDFLRRFFGEDMPDRPRSHRSQGVGSGFIVDSAGVVVTNFHVVAGATSILIKLSDGREVPARLVGQDQKTDVAVLRIEGKGPFPTVAWGDSDHIRPGDSVFAVGSPFGLGGTVTAGIVSGRGRDIGAGPYDDFLQVDAPINPGNSGGPLFDSMGRVIGINAAIASPSGGNVGIGFAIPARLAQGVIAQLVSHGQVTRGQIGVSIQDVTPDIADSLGLGETRGALIADVMPGSPAASAGLRAGDIVIRFGTTAIATPKDLSRAVADAPVGSNAPIVVRRGRDTLTQSIRIGQQTAEQSGPRPAFAAGGVPSDDSRHELFGMMLAPTSPALNQRAGLPDTARGVMVTDVDPDSTAAERGVRPGDLIVSVNHGRVSSPQAIALACKTAAVDGRRNVLLEIRRGDTHAFIPVPAT